MKITETIKMAIGNHEFTIGIFQDLFKAFDTVNHNILLQKLDFYGIRGLCNHCFRDYLAERQQIVKNNSTYSENKSIKCGVPQGSVLGPLLFLLYVNDIHTCSNLLCFILFTDDTNLYISGKNIEKLEILVSWLKWNVYKQGPIARSEHPHF